MANTVTNEAQFRKRVKRIELKRPLKVGRRNGEKAGETCRNLFGREAELLFAVYADEQTRPDLLPRDIAETTISSRKITRRYLYGK